MSPGTKRLHEELDAMRQALEAFDDPTVEEHAGLRLMQEVLTERRDHLAEQIRDAETASVSLRVEHPDGGVPVSLAHALLAGLQDAVRAAGAELASPGLDDDARARALDLVLASVSSGKLVVERRPGPLAAQPVTDDGVPLVDAAMRQVLGALAGGPALDAIAPLARSVLEHGVVVEMELHTSDEETAAVRLDQAAAQQLV